MGALLRYTMVGGRHNNGGLVAVHDFHLAILQLSPQLSRPNGIERLWMHSTAIMRGMLCSCMWVQRRLHGRSHSRMEKEDGAGEGARHGLQRG